MNKERKLWIGFALVMCISFSVLGYYGYEIYQQAPPIPTQIKSPDKTVIFTSQEIKDGQNIWQSIGGQEVGTIWGHGAYVAPDWTADWLHREAVFILEKLSQKEYSKTYAQLTEDDLTYTEGQEDELLGKLQQVTGKGRAELIDFINKQ